ncbi:MAG: IS110 family transposase, partial [Paracoccus sp. (in: a-proteobacteria)]|nr:IS110 family transposase [Paracoccus sp. (in: a-proteobacteria)]
RPTLAHRCRRGAVTSSKPNPVLKVFADRLRAAGKPHKVVVIAVARKLVTIANALCKSRLKWTNQAA